MRKNSSKVNFTKNGQASWFSCRQLKVSKCSISLADWASAKKVRLHHWGIWSVGGFLTLRCDTDATYNQSLCSNEYFCSLPIKLVCIISGGYKQCDFYRIFSAAIIYLPSILCMHCWYNLALNESHDNHWRDSGK